jgi:uncharacterized repeat protein (TIGR01451 family)
MQTFVRRPPCRLGLAFLLALGMAGGASAQVQRSFVNLGFEAPALVTPGCRVYIAATQVPGWQTTHVATASENSGGCVVPGGFVQTAPILELWRTPRDNSSGGSVSAPQGVQIAELNAAAASRIYQNVCLINGEKVSWRFSHRGRGSASVRDIAEMKIGASGTVVRVGTTNNGASDPLIVTQGTATKASVAGNTSWVRYQGDFTYAGASGQTNMGFEAISAQGGATNGNLLDDIQIELAPFVEFVQPSSSSPEATGGNLPTLRVNGTVTTAFTVTVRITGGTATRGTDYTTPGNSDTLAINVPVGTYDGASAASLFPVPVTITNDALAESNETILFAISAPPPTNPPFLLASSATCGGAVQTTWTYTIVDDDASISLSKNAAAPVPVAGNPAQADIAYTIVANNPSASTAASYSLVDTPAFDADASIVSASFSRNGGAATSLSGGGPWTLQPQWRTLAAGATDTYVVTVRININRGGSVGNDSCASPSAAGNGLHNAVRAVVQGSGGNPNMDFNSSGCQPTPTPVWVTLRKQLQGRVAATDQAQVRVFSGGIAAANATTTGSAMPASASTGTLVLAAGNIVQFEEAIKTGGTGADRPLIGYRPAISCSNAGTPTSGLPTGAGSDAGNRQQWPEFTPAAGADIDCTISNAVASANLGITKSNNLDSVVSGSQVTYGIAVRNAGPDAADGAVLADPVPTGLQDCALAAPACSASGGASCPATGSGAGQLSIANLQGTGVVLPVLPNGGAVTIQVTCTVQ